MRSRRLPYRRQLPRQPTNPRASFNRECASTTSKQEHRDRSGSAVRRPYSGTILRRGQRPRRSIRCWPGAQGAEIRRSRCLLIDLDGKWNILKQCDGTKACDESPITVACYLCNTLPKTAEHPLFRAVPLLRVQSPSVIVMLRRRGASRGRPVIRWFA
jgi:hypothetical protein